MSKLASILLSIFTSLKSKQSSYSKDTTIETSNGDPKPINVKSSKLKGYKIVIDPGHGGRNGRKDPGAIGKYKNEEIYERNVVLTISIELALLLETLGMEVVLTRINNEELSTLQDKVNIVNKEKPDVFISIHANANEGAPGRGIETLYNSSRPESIKFAKRIQNEMIKAFPDRRDRGLKERNALYVLSRHSVSACCLVECEFINHSEGAAFLVEKPKEIAEALVKGIYTYLKAK